MNRRSLLKRGFALAASGLLLPDLVAAEPERRVWVLDRTMLRRPGHISLDGLAYPVAPAIDDGARDWPIAPLSHGSTVFGPPDADDIVDFTMMVRDPVKYAWCVASNGRADYPFPVKIDHDAILRILLEGRA